MKNHFLIILLFCLSFLMAGGSGQAKIGREKPVEIPREIRGITAAPELLPYLDSPDKETRMGAVKRLGEIGTPGAIESLISAFNKAPYLTGIELPRGIQEEVITALRNIGSEEAKEELLVILNTYIKDGPRLKDGDHYVWHDCLYLRVVDGALKALGNWKDEEVFGTFKKVANDINLWWSVRRIAFEEYFKVSMEREGIVSMKDSIDYLLKIQKSLKDKERLKSPESTESIKEKAIMEIIRGYGPTALPYLDHSLRESPSSESHQREVIRQVINGINRDSQR